MSPSVATTTVMLGDDGNGAADLARTTSEVTDLNAAVQVLTSQFAPLPPHGVPSPASVLSSEVVLSSVARRVEAKHASWVRLLRQALEASTDPVTQVLLGPATSLDPLGTALHIARMQPREVVLLPLPLRSIVLRFQSRANELGVVELLPQLQAVQQRATQRHGTTEPTTQRREPRPRSKLGPATQRRVSFLQAHAPTSATPDDAGRE